MRITIPIEPMGKPRMTQGDKFNKRPVVQKYWRFKDKMKDAVGEIKKDVVGVSWTAYLSMPKSWNKKKKLEHKGCLHRSTPDRDNIDKAILDALFKDDSGIATGSIEKRWDDGKGARIELIIC